VSHRAESLNGSDGDHGLEPGESIIADGGSGAAQQKKGSDLVQKRATLELSLLHLHDNLSYVENEVTCDGAKPSCTENIVKKFTNLNVDLDPSVHKYSENAAVRPHTSDSTHVSSDLYVRSSRKFEASDSFNQQKMFSAKEKLFAPRTTVSQYRPRNLGGNGIKSVARGTKPGPQWCLTGLTHTQKRWIQRLRALLIPEEIAKKKCDEWFSRDRSMVPPKVTWRAKRIMIEENKNVDDTVPTQNSENSRDAPTGMDIDKGG
jgi:hypothetical protein